MSLLFLKCTFCVVAFFVESNCCKNVLKIMSYFKICAEFPFDENSGTNQIIVIIQLFEH